MALIVQKYGGSSVGNLDRIHHVAKKVIKARQEGHQVVVVVSAMYGETDRLIQMAHALTQTPDAREYDVLLSTGEQVSMSLLSMALNMRNCPARSFTAAQAGIYTDPIHTRARIVEVKTHTLQNELNQGRVVVVAGFQGITTNGDTTTLGRGGSDTTAVAIAAALQAEECQIYTDVDGVYTIDPHLFPKARLLPEISFEEMLEMASLGAKVLQLQSVELASLHRIPIRVLSTFSEGSGTLVTFEDQIMNKRPVSGIAVSREEAVIAVSGVPRHTGWETRLLGQLNEAQIEIDLISQNTAPQDHLDFSFTVQRRDFSKALKLVEEAIAGSAQNIQLRTNTKAAKLTLIGLGMRSQTSIPYLLLKTLDEADIQIHMLASSEIKLSVILDENQLDTAVKTIHHAFALDKIEGEEAGSFSLVKVF